MSIISSLTKANFAIMKSDTRGSAGSPLPFVCPKGMKLEKDQRVILITFCGVLNFGGIDTYCRIKAEQDKLFEMYDTVGNQNAWHMGEYLRGIYAPMIKSSPGISGIENLVIHIISKRDHILGYPFMCRVEIDFRNGRNVNSSSMFGIEQGYSIARDGGDAACAVFSLNFPDDAVYVKTEFDVANYLLQRKMEEAIKADVSCGLPIDTFSFKIS